MFNYKRLISTKEVFTRIRVDFTINAWRAEFIVAYSSTRGSSITSKKQIREVIKQYLFNHGTDFDNEAISFDEEEVEQRLNEARLVVKKLMPELYK